MLALEDVQIIPPGRGMVCMDCESISNTKRDCPACGGANLWPVMKWLERTVKDLEEIWQQQN